jgi:putative membrane protein
MKMASVLGHPELCWCAATAVLVTWHIPSSFSLGMKSASWHFAEESSFLVAGLLFWWPVIQPGCAGKRTSGTADLSLVLYLFLATLPCDILSGFLVFCDRVVYPAYFSSSHMFGLSPLGDQQCAAALMWTLVTIIYLVAGALLMFRSFSQVSGPETSSAQRALIGVAPEKVQQRLEAF